MDGGTQGKKSKDIKGFFPHYRRFRLNTRIFRFNGLFKSHQHDGPKKTLEYWLQYMPDGMKHSRIEATTRVSEAIRSAGESGASAGDTLHDAPPTPENLVHMEKAVSERRAEPYDRNQTWYFSRVQARP